MDTPLPIKIASSAPALFVALLLLLFLFHALFVWWRLLSPTCWKWVDYIWLIVASLALVSIAPQIRQAWLAPQINVASYQVQIAFDRVRETVVAGTAMLCGPASQRQVNVPPGTACGDFLILTQQISAVREHDNQPALSFLTGADAAYRARWSDRTAQDAVDAVHASYAGYVAAIQKRQRLQHELLARPEESQTLFALPSVLVITLALRLTKVSGELRHARGRPGIVEAALRRLLRQSAGQE